MTKRIAYLSLVFHSRVSRPNVHMQVFSLLCITLYYMHLPRDLGPQLANESCNLNPLKREQFPIIASFPQSSRKDCG